MEFSFGNFLYAQWVVKARFRRDFTKIRFTIVIQKIKSTVSCQMGLVINWPWRSPTLPVVARKPSLKYAGALCHVMQRVTVVIGRSGFAKRARQSEASRSD